MKQAQPATTPPFPPELEDLSELSEKIARHVHEVWMQGRIAAGWSYGTQRDDTRLTHPSIVPYEELSEEEKDYDRRTSQETLIFIIKQGFTINKNQ